MIGEVGQAGGAPVVDLSKELGFWMPDAWFEDTLHPNTTGARKIAEALAPAIEAAVSSGSPAPRG